MKKKRISFLFIIQVFLIVSACKQIYDPHLAETGETLVVEALMTNDPETYYVKLSSTIPYNSTFTDRPVTNASVSVTDVTDNSILLFSETRDGYYTFTADSGARGVIGHSYVLHIVTTEGERFESLPELLNGTSGLDTVYGQLEERNVLIESTSDGSTLYKKVAYLNIMADIKNTEPVSRGIRFRPKWLWEMIDYHEDCSFNCPPPTYIWKYYEDGQYSISETKDHQGLREQPAGSVQLAYFKMLYHEQHLAYIVLILNNYYLNEDSYGFYKDVKEQLAANNAIFDPITTQIEGNIQCLNDPEKKALGLFEVSSHETCVFMVTPDPPVVKTVRKFRRLPVETEGSFSGEPPDWWIVQ
jgi:hypothetical protein